MFEDIPDLDLVTVDFWHVAKPCQKVEDCLAAPISAAGKRDKAAYLDV